VELPRVNVVIPPYIFESNGRVTPSGRRTRPIIATNQVVYYREVEFRSHGNPNPCGFRQRWLADRLLEISRVVGSSDIPFAFLAREHDGASKKFYIDKGCVPFLQRRDFVGLVTDHDGYVTSLRLSDIFFETYSPRDLADETARPSTGAADRVGEADQLEALRQQLSRLVAGIRQSVASAGTERGGINPLRSIPEDTDLLQMLTQRWHEQSGVCALCDRQIPLYSANRLLRISRDRTDSANSAYDWENTRLTHLACNLGKNDASTDDWSEYLAMIREQSQ
jgi:hypothetical protein